MPGGILAGSNLLLIVLAQLDVLAATVPMLRVLPVMGFGTKYAPSCWGRSLTSATIAIGSFFAEDGAALVEQLVRATREHIPPRIE